jgi:RecB family exonuclease
VAETLALPGLAAERGISASALVTLLGCPYRFLLQRVLHLQAPTARPPSREIGQPDYGSLVHRIMEAFFRQHGPEFCRRERTLETWNDTARDVADRCYAEFLGEYPLAGDGAVDTQRDRVRRDVEHLLRAEWDPRRRAEFVGVEIPFGYPTPVPVALGDRILHVHGFIDRVDGPLTALRLRDIKTGRPKMREDEEVNVCRDAQIALYALVAPAAVGGGRVVSAAYVYPVAAGDPERVFAGADLDALRVEAREWFGLAADLLAARSFPHAAAPNACSYCEFQPVCGDTAAVVSRRKLATAEPGCPAARFATLQGVTEREDDD